MFWFLVLLKFKNKFMFFWTIFLKIYLEILKKTMQS